MTRQLLEDDRCAATAEAEAHLVREVFRRVVRDLRQETRHPPLTQGQLAARLGISREQVVEIESGRSATGAPADDRLAPLRPRPREQ